MLKPRPQQDRGFTSAQAEELPSLKEATSWEAQHAGQELLAVDVVQEDKGK